MLFLVASVFTAFRKQKGKQRQSKSSDFSKKHIRGEEKQAHVVDYHSDTRKNFKRVTVQKL